MDDLPAHAILTNAQMAAADAATIRGGRWSGSALMDHAGAAVADCALARFGAARRMHVLCGPGNNGGDGYVAARILAERGACVRVHRLAPPRPDTDAAGAAQGWKGEVAALDAFDPAPADLVIDALFGAGFSGSLPQPAAAALARAADRSCPILAVDLPSGVNGDTGLAAQAVKCAATVTFYRRKPAHLLYPGRALCGAMVVADIGVRAGEGTSVFANAPALWSDLLPRPAPTIHKYARGAVAVCSGPRHATGAARLSAMAAQRSGAGAVTIVGAPDALDIHACHVSSIMLRSSTPDTATALAALKGLGGIVLGPGFGDLAAARVLAVSILRDLGATVVLDADAITACAQDPRTLFEAAHRAPSPPVLTPHAGEFARLFPDLAADDGLGKLQRAMAAARRSGATVLLKGPDTVIAAPDGRAAINENATAALATAGSGDALAGIIAALVAQGMPTFEASCGAAFIHAEAGRRAGPLAIAEDIVQALPGALAAV
ncbi:MULTISPECIES: NAD(P)H-hydrate dehydratase [unclassified Roseitalea]|uniref:NAD(P)H-hydrate dehydratase n=1 Tax=unclassified Roseitalea TaxID=2639107 RepID=UPI0027402C67|nr:MULTISPECIES: NAD(P)H-hydrate dehydratase [unclassified Roseitalea]